MKVNLLKTAYITEDGSIFESKDSFRFVEILEIVGKSASSEEAECILNEKGILYKRYKVTEV